MTDICHEVWIKASASEVFDAITSKRGIDRWWGPCLRAQPAVGEIVEFDHGLADPLRMRITELVPDRRVGWRCVSDFAEQANPASEWLGTSLEFDLRPGRDDPARGWMGERLGATGDLTILEFRHANWPAGARWFPFCNAAWGVTLSGLAQTCESLAGAAAR